MKISELAKVLAMMAAGLVVVPIVSWMESLADKERLRVINEKRKANGDPPFATLWEYYKETRDEGY